MQFFSSAISFFNFYYCLSLLFYFYIHIIIGERAKRARHSQVCSIENHGYIYYYHVYIIYSTCKFCSYNPYRRRSVILKLLPELFVYFYVALCHALQQR